MAKVELSPILQSLAGSFGEGLVFRRGRKGKVFLIKKAVFPKNRKYSADQKSHQTRFAEAASWAKKAAKENPKYKILAKKKSLTAYQVALSDFFKSR